MLKPVIIGAVLLAAGPVLAQDAPVTSVDTTRDTLTIGVGGAIIPRYEGSDKYTISPAVVSRGRVSGVTFTLLGTSLFVDVIPAPPGPSTKLVLGPVAHLGLNRSSLRRTRNAQVVALGKIPVSVDVGGHVGIARTGVITSEYDTLSVDVAVTHDVTQVHDSLIIIPSINYGTPLSRKAFVGVSASATHVGQKYARRYFGIDGRQSLASGLPVYVPREGFKDITIAGVANLALTGDLLHGLSAFATGSYSRLLGSFGRSPVTRDRNQLFGGIGLAYTF